MALPGCKVGLLKIDRLEDGRVIDQGEDRLVLADLIGQCLRLRRIGEVGLQDFGSPPERPDFPAEGFGIRRRVGVMDEDICAILGQCKGDMPANAPGAAGDQNGFIR